MTNTCGKAGLTARLVMLSVLAATGLPGAAIAADAIDDGVRWEVSASPYALHWRHDDDHRHVYALGVERIQADDSLAGAYIFRNSFGQASAYAYVGRQWNNLLGNRALYAKLSGGLMVGYRGKFKDKVPLNVGGFSPGIVPAVGVRLTDADAVQFNILGKAGVLFSYNRQF